ncbi:MAG: nuclear transport factor 2 family protein [Rhodothermales bacterium]
MAQQNEAERLARAWIEGWIAGTPDDIPLAEDFTHSSPFGVVKGREKYLEWVKPLAAQNVVSLKIIKTLGVDREAVIWFEMESPNGLVPSCDWVETKDGEIVAIQSFYDATGLV